MRHAAVVATFDLSVLARSLSRFVMTELAAAGFFSPACAIDRVHVWSGTCVPSNREGSNGDMPRTAAHHNSVKQREEEGRNECKPP